MKTYAISRIAIVIIIIAIIILGTATAFLLSQRPSQTTTTSTTITTSTITTTPIQTTTTTTLPSQVPNPDTLIVEDIGEPQYIDPAVDYETVGAEIITNVYETLVWYNGTNSSQIVPWLAERWEVSNNGMSYTFYLRKGIKFQDGTPFNATAVKYSLERTIIIGDPHGPAWIYGVIRGAEALLEKIWNGNATQADVDAWRAQKPIEILDTYTVRINLDRPYAPFLALMAFNLGAGIVSPTYVEAHGGVQIGKQNDWMNRHAEAGTGPFKVISWESGVITLEANPNYWGGPNNIKPKLKYVIRKTVDDVNTRILDFLQGSADIVNIPSDYWNQFIDMNKWLTNHEVVSIKSGVRAIGPLETFVVNYIGLNQRIKDTSGKLLDFQPFQDKRVRMAFAYAFDYDTYIKDVIKGAGIRLNGPIPKGMFGYDPTIPLYTYNLTKAKELLLEAGKDLGFSPENPKQLTIYYNSGNTVREKVALLLASTINSLNVGLSISVIPLAWPQYLGLVRKGMVPMYVLGWAPDYIDPDDYVTPFGHIGLGTIAKRVSYNNTRVMRLVEQQSVEIDPVKRAQILSEIVRIMHDDYAYIWLDQPVDIHFERTWVHGWFWNPAIDVSYYATVYKS